MSKYQPRPASLVCLLAVLLLAGSFSLHAGDSGDAGPDALNVQITDRADWGARPAIPVRMKPNPAQLTSATIHHTAVVTKPGQDEAQMLRGIQRFHMDDKHWGDIAYHYLIGPSGKIYEARDPRYVADTMTNYDPTGHLCICLLGNFEEQQPTAEALNSLARLTAIMLHKYHLTPDQVLGHRELAATACPGKHLQNWLKNEGLAQIRQYFGQLQGNQ